MDAVARTDAGGERMMINPEFNEILSAALDKAKEIAKANECAGCAFQLTEEWELPCRKCKRNCKDYYRRRYGDG